MNVLRECKLGEVIKFGNGKSRPASEGDIPIYGGNGVLGYCADSNYDGETIVIGRVGAYCGATYYEDRAIWVSDNALSAKPKARNNAKYLYYFLKHMDLNQHAGGSSHPLVTQTLLNSIDVELVEDQNEQKAIASVLSSLDDKIDLLHRQNKTLEAMAETLFRQWFVVEAQDDWEEGTLSDLVESANTGLDAIKRAPIVDVFTGIKCLRIQDISQKKKFEDWGNSRVLEKDFEKAQLKTGDLIMARTCSPGIIYFVRENLSAVFNNGLARIRPKPNKTHSIFLYYLFRTGDFIGYISGISGGTSVQLNMKLGDLLSYKLTFPPKELQDRYHPFFQSLDNKIFINYSQIRTLETLRDTLLPKLMSGEVRVAV